MWPLKTILFVIAYVIACIASLFNPAIGALNYIVVYQIDPQSTWWGLPLLEMGFRLSLMAAICVLIGVLLRPGAAANRGRVGAAWELGVVGLTLCGVFSVFYAPIYTVETLARLDKLWKMMLFVLLLGRLINTRQKLRLLLWGFVICTLYLGREAYLAPPSRFYLGRLNDIGGPDFRYSSGIAVHMAAMIPLVGAAYLTSRSWAWKILALGTGALAVNTLILCRTRSAFVGVAAGLLAAILIAPRTRRMRIYSVLFVCLAVGYSLTDRSFWERMATITDFESHEEDTAIITRKEVWAVGLDMIAEHPFGVGAGNFERMTLQYYAQRRAAHNTLLNCVAELGIHAGILYVSLLALTLNRLRVCNRLAKEVSGELETRFLAFGIMVSIVTYLVAGYFTERFYTESFWWILTMPLCLHRVLERERLERHRRLEMPRRGMDAHEPLKLGLSAAPV